MKKIIAFLITLTMVFGLSAVSMDPAYADSPFAKVGSVPGVIDARALGMGGAVLADPDNTQSIWTNPAGLAEQDIQFSLPSVGFTIYNPLAIVKASETSEKFDEKAALDAILNSLTTGYGKLLDVDAQVSFSAGGFGLGFNVKDSIYTYAPKGSTGGASSKFYDAITSDIVLGYGFRLGPSPRFSIDLGATAGLSILTYTENFGVSDLASAIDGGADALLAKVENTPIAFGYAIPITIGAKANLPLGFAVAAVANINNSYDMKIAPNYKAMEDDSIEMEGFTIEDPFSFDLGASWSMNFLGKFFRPVVAVDIEDVFGLIASKDYSTENLIQHVNIGAEVRGLWIFDIRAGINDGYWTAGAAIDLGIIKLDAAYYWQEMGNALGQKGVDALTIKANIGW